MKKLYIVMTAAMVACAPGPAPTAKVWTPREFFKKVTQARASMSDEATKPVFGGWAPAELLVTEGETMPYSTRVQGRGPGLTVFPGVSAGRAVGFIITDIWQDHPEAWVQPVYVPSSKEALNPRRFELPVLFPVGLDSTFYSPWWRAQKVLVDAGVKLTSAKQVLEASLLPAGPLVLCPVVSPSTIGVATEVDKPRHPLTDRAYLPVATSQAFVDGEEVTYLNLGMGRAPFDGQRLVEADLVVFTNEGVALPVAAVWPDEPGAHGFLRRVEVPVPEGAAFFVPANRPDLRAPLGTLLAPDVRAALDRFPEYGLRLARNPACFSAPDFPTGCDWLDAHDKVRGLPFATRREAQLTAAVLVEAP